MRRGFWWGAEAAFCLFALSVVLGAYTTIPLRLQGVSLQGGVSSPYSTAAMAVLLAGLLLLVAVRRHEFLFVARHGGPVNLLLLLALASALWSDVPEVSLRRWLTLMAAVAFAYYLAATHPIARVLRRVAAAIGLSLLASAALALAFPEAGVMREPTLAGAWAGVYGHKSTLGGVTVIGTLCFGWLWRNDPRRRPLHALGVLLCAAMAVLSQSRTAQLTILLVVSFSLFLPLLRLPGLARIWAVYGVVFTGTGFGALLAVFFGDIMAWLGKDPSLSGRVPAWSSLLDMAAERPLGGHGYNAFFVLGNDEIQNVWRHSGWDMWEAHNAFLDITLQLGLPGLLLVSWIILELIRRSAGEWAEGALPWASFALVFALTHTATSLVESNLFRTGDIVTLLLALLLVALRLRRAAQAAAAQAAAPRPGRRLHPAYALYR